MRILIADDEKPARSELRYILEDLLPEAVFFEAVNGQQTLKLIEQELIDAAFLDINMPAPNGLEAAAVIMDCPEPPLIIFATAYNQHALRAFELAALDYVVKPFDERRLTQTAQRIRQALDERAVLAEKRRALRQYLLQHRPAQEPTKLWGEKENQNRVLVDYKDILWLTAQRKKTWLRTLFGDELRVHYTLKELEPRLKAQNFARVHKSYIVNLDHIAEVAPWFSGAYIIRMNDEARTEIPMSRRYAAQLKKLTGWR